MARTLVIAKPDAVERGLTGEIIGRLERKGLRVVAAELRTIDESVAARHYAEHQGKPFYDELVRFITRSPSMVMVVEGPDRDLRVVRNLMGATDPDRRGTGHDPGRPRVGDGGEPRPRFRLGGVGRRGRSAFSSPRLA